MCRSAQCRLRARQRKSAPTVERLWLDRRRDHHDRLAHHAAALDDIAAESGASLATIALAWTKAQPGITAPIASATSLEQFADLAAALTFDLTPGEIESFNAASE